MTDKKDPYIDSSGHVVIPFNSDPQYHFWKGGQPLSITLQEMKVTEDVCDLSQILVPHVKLGFRHFLFLNSGTPLALEDGNSKNCVA